MTRKKKPFPKPWLPKRCPGCLNPVKGTDSRSSWILEDFRYWFHSHCFDRLHGSHGRTSWKVKEAIVNFVSAGYKAEIAPPEPQPRIKSPKAHVQSFEHSEGQKGSDLDSIVELLVFVKRPMSRKEIAIEAQVPYTTVCWRVWEHLDNNPRGVSTAMFELAEQRGPRGIELIQLVTRKE